MQESSGCADNKDMTEVEPSTLTIKMDPDSDYEDPTPASVDKPFKNFVDIEIGGKCDELFIKHEIR